MDANSIPITIVGKPKVVRATKGRDSKYSSKVYCYQVEDLQEEPKSELDRWFGPVDAVARRRAYGL